MFIIFFSFFGFHFLFLFFCNFVTSHPPPAIRYPSPATRYPSPVTRHPRKSPAAKMAEASGGEEVTTNSDDRIAKSDDTESHQEKPTCILCLGMAGSGKTTFVPVFLKF